MGGRNPAWTCVNQMGNVQILCSGSPRSRKQTPCCLVYRSGMDQSSHVSSTLAQLYSLELLNWSLYWLKNMVHRIKGRLLKSLKCKYSLQFWTKERLFYNYMQLALCIHGFCINGFVSMHFPQMKNYLEKKRLVSTEHEQDFLFLLVLS